MKRVTKIMVAAAAVVLALAGCKRGEQVSPLNTIYATMASHSGVNPSGGKSHIDGNSVCWSKNDTIALITTGDEKIAGEKIAYTLSGDGGSTTGTFTGVEPQTKTGPYCVVYPYGSVKSYSYNVDDRSFTVEYSLPEEQSYSENSFGEGANLSIGYSNDYNFKFLNMMGVLKVTIKNRASCIVEKVELVSRNESDVLWGDGTVTIKGSTADSLSFGTRTRGDHILTLGNYMKWDAGDVSLYFVVPAGTLQSGFEIKIYEYGYKYPITEYAPGETIEFINTNIQEVIQRNTVSVLDFGDRLIRTYGYVDLGKAGKWAQCNYGADKPYEPGGYYQFGGMVNVFGLGKDDESTLKEACPFIGKPIPTQPARWTWTKYGSEGDTLCSDDDVACGIGKDWYIPDKNKLSALKNNCNFTWEEVNGVKGVLAKSKTNGNYMFLPACGYWGWEDDIDVQSGPPVHKHGDAVYIGSKTVQRYDNRSAITVVTFETGSNGGPSFKFIDKFLRVFGVPIRPVYFGSNEK